MKKLAAFACLGCLVVIFGAWLVGVRLVVIQPIGAIPEGVTAVVYGVPNLRLVDSPHAICQRIQGGVSLLCRGMTAAAIANRGKILARLPYSEMLFRPSGAPELDR